MNLPWSVTRAQWVAAITLATIAGYVDGYGLLFLGSYVSFMSGNTTSAGLRSGQGLFTAAFPSAVAITSFVAGSFVANLLSESKLRHFRRLVFVLLASGLAIVSGLEYTGVRHVFLELLILSTAMGMVNPALSKVGLEPVSLTFVTGTLSRIGGHLASAVARKPPELARSASSHLARAGIEASVWCGFLGGAILFGFVGSHFRTLALLPPFAAVVSLAALSDGGVALGVKHMDSAVTSTETFASSQGGREN